MKRNFAKTIFFTKYAKQHFSSGRLVRKSCDTFSKNLFTLPGMTYNLFFLNSINKNKAETTVFSLKRIKCCFISFTLQTFTTVSMKKLKEDDFYSASSPTNNNVFQETGGGRCSYSSLCTISRQKFTLKFNERSFWTSLIANYHYGGSSVKIQLLSINNFLICF